MAASHKLGTFTEASAPVVLRQFLIACCVLLAACWMRAHAAEPVGAKPAWQQLTPMQKEALGPLQTEWERFNADRKRKWLNIAARYPAMSPQQRATLHRRMSEWVHMTPQQRRLARENFLATGKAPLDSRKEAWERYQKLPEAEKRRLAHEAKSPPKAPGSVSRYVAEEHRRHPKRSHAPAARASGPGAKTGGVASVPPNAGASTPAVPQRAPSASD
jgi:hypothetical protein